MQWWVRCDWSINFISVPFYILMNSICSRYAHLESRHHETLFDGFIQKWRQMFDQIGLIWHHSFAEGLYLYFNRPFCRKKSLLILNPDQVGPETPSRFFVTIKVLWRLLVYKTRNCCFFLLLLLNWINTTYCGRCYCYCCFHQDIICITSTD